MILRRFFYCLTLIFCAFIYVAVGSWLSWMILLCVAVLPWLSLLISLPAIRGFRVAPTGVETLQMGEEASLWILGSCRAPMPPFRGNLRVQECFTGTRYSYRPDPGLSTAHCGGLLLSVEQGRVCDYLGLFAFRPRHREEKTVYIRPVPVELPEPIDLDRFSALRWKPKPAGGFSENHELRPYRPGDSMTGIHWKLSAKTGNLMVREPMEPEQGRILLTMDLMGTPDQLDRKMGQLLRLSQILLAQQLCFTIRVHTGLGILEQTAADASQLKKAIDTLLCQPIAKEGSVQDAPAAAFWQYHIGGGTHEA